MMGRKRGGKNLTKKDLAELGFNEIGKFCKHKFRFLLNGWKKKKEEKEIKALTLFDKQN